MKKRIFSLFFVSALAMGLLSCAYLQTQQRQLAEKLVRLHVVANSDSPSDQAIKLRVRDAVLAAAEPVLGSADDPEQALAAELPALECAAAEMLRALGREESVSVTLQNERFPTRDYETFSLPAGVYRTLRVTIGVGEGHNWWCVLFPQMCIPTAVQPAAEFSDEQLKVLERRPQYEPKFALLELFYTLTGENALDKRQAEGL